MFLTLLLPQLLPLVLWLLPSLQLKVSLQRGATDFRGLHSLSFLHRQEEPQRRTV